MTMSPTVLKIGGSLLDLPELGPRIERVVREEGITRPLLVVGGGRVADLVRDWDREYAIGEERAHWLALKAMELNESLVAELISAARIVRAGSEADEAWRRGELPILNAHGHLTDLEQAGETTVPHRWSVTSDGVAAWTACRWSAERLVFLKSTDLPVRRGVLDLVEGELLDPYCGELLPECLGRMSVDWINLRSEPLRAEAIG